MVFIFTNLTKNLFLNDFNFFTEDSEEEDDIIKPSDNLILVGHVEDDSASLEVYSKLKTTKIKSSNFLIPKISVYQFIMSKKTACTFIMIFFCLVFLYA